MLAVIETSRNHALGPKAGSTCSSSSSQNRHETEHAHLIDVLSELYNLLEDFSPAWYTETYRLRAESALHVKQR